MKLMRTVIFATIFILSLFTVYMHISDYREVNKVVCVKINGGERIQPAEGLGYYVVFTDSTEYMISDDVFRGIRDASSTYGRLLSDREAEWSFTTAGVRRPYWSMYPNIISIPQKCGQ